MMKKWLIGFVAPFGGQDVMVEELRLKILPGKRMKMLQARPEGGTVVHRRPDDSSVRRELCCSDLCELSGGSAERRVS
jgi:RTX toxin acyltransferase family